MTLNEAAQKNNGFERPVAYFKLNDAPLSGESLIYHDVRVTLTAGMEARWSFRSCSTAPVTSSMV